MRELSMQAPAVRKRNQRERQRAALLSTVTPAVAPPVTAPAAAAAPAPAAVQPSAPAAAPSSSSRAAYALHETEVVSGAGADAYSAPTAIEGEEGAAGPELVEPAPPPPKPQTTPQEAALIGAAIRKYCEFGWGELASRNQAAMQRLLPNPQHQAMVFVGGLEMVEKSATALALKHNIRIPYGDELTVGLGVGVATLGLVGTFKAPKNDNAAAAKRAKSANAANETPSVTRDVSREDAQEDKDDDSPIAAAPSASASVGSSESEDVVLG